MCIPGLNICCAPAFLSKPCLWSWDTNIKMLLWALALPKVHLSFGKGDFSCSMFTAKANKQKQQPQWNHSSHCPRNELPQAYRKD